jgi:hypothetical protein
LVLTVSRGPKCGLDAALETNMSMPPKSSIV